MQIETQQGLDNLEAIAGVDGVDGVFIGPGDLSAALGYLGNPGHPEVQAVIEDAIGRIKACGKAPGLPDRRRDAGPALHRAGLPVHRRRRRHRHPGARLRAARGQVQAAGVGRRHRAAREDKRAEVRGQPDHALQRARLRRPVRRGRRRRLRGGRVPVPLPLPEGAAGRAAQGARADPGAAQPAGRRLGRGRARHRLPARPRRGVPRRRGQSDRVRDGTGLQAGQLPGRHRAQGRARGRRAPDLRREPALRRARARQGRHQAAGRGRSTPATSRASS